ncbi:thiamine pyrophosphate-dependent enzyme, possible carboligase or decarboxylase [Halococcus morrhuae DSM 1307]|uniref:Thiamine pyrophosphate-dependent enzyme, possible carboligase or decarboxylase n=1 Tax=Halococcus morrhuae DSM 1307 TaxID=931277 RepID=M0M4I9_HALMO|nr:thiamine pyrophosphate-binding protein [Halococcus morrhuae]EMA40732.1 thiamine pyrophosphate-dependent enzyme, possible carboligase or decarboxylase [Halococcus morrhuae DSM 1307]
MTTVSTEIVRTLERLDVEYLFGYPGGRAIELLEALAESTIEVVRPRDEREASVMAEMHGRLHRKPGVLTGQGPWIGSIGAIGQLEARLGSSPMVVLTEASERGEYSTLAPYQQARGDYGGFALPKILDGITKEWWFPRTAKETLRTTQLAFKHATAGRPGPTAVILDGDAVTAEIPETDEPPTLWPPEEQVRNWESCPTGSDVERAAEHLATADRPVIVAGNGVHAAGAYDELEAVAERYEAVVTTSYLGKSTIAETHSLAAGVIGSFGHEGANRAVSEADTLLVVGCRLNPMDTNWGSESFVRPDEQTIIHADIDSRNAGWVYPADVGLIGDAKRSLSALDRAAEAYAPSNDWARERARDARESFRVSECKSDDEPIKPQRAVAAIDELVDENTLVTADSGNNRFWLLNYLKTPARRTYFGSGGVGGMGWAGPAAVSAAITTDRDVVAVAGDGGFTMTMTCVETAVEYGVAPTFVVLNDTSLGMVRQMDDSIPGVEFHDTDFVRVAEGFGAEGTCVRSPANLDGTLATAKAADVPTVVDIRIDPDEEMAEKLQSSFYESVGGLHE